MEYRNVLTICPYCGTGCGLYLQVLDGEIVGVLPAKEHPVSQGKLCIKGWNAAAFVHHPDRLTRPLVRQDLLSEGPSSVVRGPSSVVSGPSSFVEVDWDTALGLIAERLTAIRSQSGPDALGFLVSAKCTNEENYLVQKLARAFFQTNNVDHCARLCHAPSVAGLAAAFGSGAMTNSTPEFSEHTRCFLITGSNTTETHPLIASHVMKAKERGAKLIVIDPREVQIGRMADLYLRPRPGTDVAWLNGLMYVIISEELADQEFIQERTEGFEEMWQVVRKYPPERVEEISGIPADALREAARMYATHKPAAILYTMGITQHTTGTDNVKSVANLAMLTGNLGIPGGGVNPLRGQNNVQGASDMGGLPNVYPAYQPVTSPEAKAKFEAAWGVEGLADQVGLTVVEMVHAAGEGRLRALYVMGENPMLSDPDVQHTRECLEKLDFLVVQDIFLTETAQLAHVVLPGVTFAEKDGTFTATDRRIQRVRKAVEPPGEAKADWEIICMLAQRLGAKGFEFASPEEVMAEIARVAPSYGGVTYERLDREGFLQWPVPSVDHPGTPYLHKGKFTRGLGKFHPIEFREAAELPDEEYPFILTTGRLMFHYHTGTMTRRSEKLEQEAPEPYVEMNPDDAARIGLDGVRRVRVISRRGEIELAVRLTERIRPGVVFIPFHYAEAAANALTHAALDPVAKIPEYKVCAVRVEPVSEA
ncbi:MAG: formate dehydrogenase subunit alpha [Anaerolineae bacterium]